jgi:hypothetical protein
MPFNPKKKPTIPKIKKIIAALNIHTPFDVILTGVLDANEKPM